MMYVVVGLALGLLVAVVAYDIWFWRTGQMWK
jgi:hypothetical protein